METMSRSDEIYCQLSSLRDIIDKSQIEHTEIVNKIKEGEIKNWAYDMAKLAYLSATLQHTLVAMVKHEDELEKILKKEGYSNGR